MSLNRLKTLIATRPVFVDFPITVINGKAMSPKELVYMIEHGLIAEEKVTAALEVTLRAAEELDEETWLLAEQHYCMSAKDPQSRNVVLVTTDARLPKQLSVKEACEHVRGRTEAGRVLTEMYATLLKRIRGMI